MALTVAGPLRVRARHRGAHLKSPTRAKPRGRPQAPDTCASLSQSPAPRETLPQSRPACTRALARCDRASHGSALLPTPALHACTAYGLLADCRLTPAASAASRFAGTGKGVVIDDAARAEQLTGHQTLGVAVSWSTAERLGRDSPARSQQVFSVDALVSRVEREASRAREGTDWFVSREDLGVQGNDTDRIDRLAQNMRRSHAQTPSLEHRLLPHPTPARRRRHQDMETRCATRRVGRPIAVPPSSRSPLAGETRAPRPEG